MIEGKIRIGCFDADELAEIKQDKVAQKMIADGRIALYHEDDDKGTVWVKEGDGKAFEIAGEYAI